MRFLPLLLTCVAMPVAAFAQETGGTVTADPAPQKPAVEQAAPDAPVRSPAAPLVWPREAEAEVVAPAMASPVIAAPEPADAPDAPDAAEPAVQPAPEAQSDAQTGAFSTPAIWGGEGIEQCMVRPWINAFGDCLASLGAGEEAVRFAESLKAVPEIDMGGVMRSFYETGDVDVAIVDFPGLANSNRQVVFLNGKEPIIAAESLSVEPPQTRAVAALRAEFPAAMIAGPRDYLGARDFLDGRQRFVLIDRVTDACRACPDIAREVVFVDFLNGELLGAVAGGWLAPDLDLEALGAGVAAGDLEALQAQLVLRGYEIGGVDGIDGPMTRAAVGDFLSEHCLEGAADAPLSAAARAVLTDGAVGRCPSH